MIASPRGAIRGSGSTISNRRAISRTLDPSRDLSPTSVSHAHLLSLPNLRVSAVRASICKASHPDPSLGFQTAHALYMTTHDARPLGNERCMKTGPTHAHCDICWHISRTTSRELSTHVLADCPYSRLVVDPVMRCLLSLYAPDSPTRNHWLTCPSDTLLDTCALLLRTGCPLGLPVPIPSHFPHTSESVCYGSGCARICTSRSANKTLLVRARRVCACVSVWRSPGESWRPGHACKVPWYRVTVRP